MNEEYSYTKVNPFTAIWLQTRNTVRYVIEEKSMGYVYMLILLAGVASAFISMYQGQDGLGLPIAVMVLGAVIVSPIAVLIGIAIMSGVYLLVGKMFKGTAAYQEMFKAVATSMIPQIWLLPVLIIWMIFSPDSFFSDLNSEPMGGGAVFFTILFAIIMVVITVWGIVIQSKAIGEAHHFSSWKGFFTLLIPSIIIGILVFVLFLIIFFIIIGAASA